jgi:hypothetical protein
MTTPNTEGLRRAARRIFWEAKQLDTARDEIVIAALVEQEDAFKDVLREIDEGDLDRWLASRPPSPEFEGFKNGVIFGLHAALANLRSHIEQYQLAIADKKQ